MLTCANCPTLKASDFCRGTLVHGSQACLVGWIYKVFNDDNMSIGDISPFAFKVAKILGDMAQIIDPDGKALPEWNDAHEPRELALCWNRGMAALGYTGAYAFANVLLTIAGSVILRL